MRYDMIRQKAQFEGGFVVSHEGMTLQLLKAIGVGSRSFIDLMQPSGGRLPADENQFQDMPRRLRFMSHIIERSPGAERVSAYTCDWGVCISIRPSVNIHSYRVNVDKQLFRLGVDSSALELTHAM